MAKPMYELGGRGLYRWYKVWRFRFRGIRRMIIFSDSWTWYDSMWRFNGGGYMGPGPDPYVEITIGCFKFRTYGFPKQKA